MVKMGCFDLVGYKPTQIWAASTAMYLKSGSELGNTYLANPDGQGGHDPGPKRSFFHFTVWIGVAIKDGKCVVRMPDVLITEYLGGGGLNQLSWEERDLARSNVGQYMQESKKDVLVQPTCCGQISMHGTTSSNNPVSLDGTLDNCIAAHFSPHDTNMMTIGGNHEKGGGVRSFFTELQRQYNDVHDSHLLNGVGNNVGYHVGEKHLMNRPFCRSYAEGKTGQERQKDMSDTFGLDQLSNNRTDTRGAPRGGNKICFQAAQKFVNPRTGVLTHSIQQTGHWDNPQDDCMDQRVARSMRNYGMAS